MKNFIMKYFKTFVLLFLALTITGCRDDDSAAPASTLPVINLVAASVDEDGLPMNPLVATAVGYANNTYIIQGSGFASLKHIYFNDHESYFNPNLVTDNNIFITIDRNTPYGPDESKKLKLETGFGTVEYDFVIAPPAPLFTSFNPVNTADGEEITLYGNYFVEPKVIVGEVEATIVSYTLTRIKAILPAGSDGKKVSVTTLSGTSEWGTAVGTAIYDDQFYNQWNIPSWNNHVYITDPEKAYQGEVYISKKIDAYGNLQSDWTYDDQAVTKYKGIKFAVRSNAPGKLIFIFNGAYWGDGSRAFNTTSDWVEVEYTWAELGNPSVVQSFGFQEFSGNETTYDFDNFSYITN